MQLLQCSGLTADFPASITRFENGLTLIHQQTAGTPVAVADVWVRAGALHEPPNWSGMAHFLEHALFKGTPSLEPGEFDRHIEYCGGMANAATSYDYAHYFLTVATDRMPQVLPHLADILLHATVPDSEFDRERDVVLEELRACHDDPDWLGFQMLSASLYERHPYGRSILGTEAELRCYTPKMLRCFHRTHYQPDRMTVVLVGNFDAIEAGKWVASSFADFEAPLSCPPANVAAEPPAIGIRRSELRSPQLQQARLLMGWVGPGAECLDDAFALDVLSAVLTEGRSARWMRELREERQIVIDIGTSFSLQRDSSLFSIGAVLEPELVPYVENLLRDLLQELQDVPVNSAELKRAQRLLCNDYAFSTETPGQLAGLYGYYSTIASPELSATYPQRVQGVTPQDLQRIARQYLSTDRYAVTVMLPE
ncbi:M16 family metallopeptidase [Rubidibacter lacunae]|uniref:M16 family metallopeptidase n=1 Tax=Rubidibacter lacunae TaxID=582514 RepID=UPI00041B13B2|nr:pitrilysin family protein [Rubidibacter lacunae]